MDHRLLLSLATVAACSQTPETIVAGTGEATETVAEMTVPGQQPAGESTATSSPENEQRQAEPEEEPPVLQQADDPTATAAPEVDPRRVVSAHLDSPSLTSWPFGL